MRKAINIATMLAILVTPSFAQQPADDHAAHRPAQTQEAEALTDGEVRGVDKEMNKLTIRHSAIRNLEMPAMTMVFQVKDAAIIDNMKVGDKIKFRAEKSGSALIITRIVLAI